jgi:hypothetical protein
MHRPKILASALALALLLPVAAFAVDTGSANFTKYVAIGDSLTAGFMSGGLVRTAQVNSYPALIHLQATGSRSGFDQPLISEPGIPALLGLKSIVPVVVSPVSSGSGTLTNPLITRPYNNLGVPGARIHDTVATVTGGLHDAVLQSFSPVLRGKTALQQAVLLQPTFVTIWIGNNDVLAAATSGRVIEGVTLTPVASFQADFNTIVNTIKATGAKMAIANIPEVTSIPFVTTIRPVVVNPATNQPVLINGQTVPLIGPNGPLKAGDRVLLSATTELAQGKGIPVQLGGSGQPLSDAAVLDAGEVATITARVAAYNNIIRTVADQAGAAFVDADSALLNLSQHGISVGGVTYTSSYLTGGVFSYDGVHPTAFGYAYIADLFLDSINAKFGGRIPLVDLYPFVFGPVPTAAATVASSSSSVQGEQGGAPFVFTDAARKNLFWALNVQTDTKPRGPRHRNGR